MASFVYDYQQTPHNYTQAAQTYQTAQAYPQLAYTQTQERYTAVQGYHPQWYGYAYQQAPQIPRPAAPQPQQAPVNVTTTSATTQSQTIPQPGPATSAFTTYTPAYVRETPSASTSTGTRAPRKSQMRGVFAKELPKLMYGFGDDKQVANDTVAVMEEILIEYIVDVCQTALMQTRKPRLQIEDLRHALARPADAKKLARMEELLFMQEDIKRARKEFNDDEMGGPDVDF